MEEWKTIEIPEFQGNYEASSLGRIRTIPHECVDSFGRKRWVSQCIKATRLNPKGYPMINVRYKNRHYTFKVHRVIAQTFIPNPDNLPEVNHKDENKSNNSVENLEWCTHQYNSAYGTRGEKIGKKNSEKQKGRKLSVETRLKIAEKARGRKHTEEWKKNHSRIMREKYAAKRLEAALKL